MSILKVSLFLCIFSVILMMNKAVNVASATSPKNKLMEMLKGPAGKARKFSGSKSPGSASGVIEVLPPAIVLSSEAPLMAPRPPKAVSQEPSQDKPWTSPNERSSNGNDRTASARSNDNRRPRQGRGQDRRDGQQNSQSSNPQNNNNKASTSNPQQKMPRQEFAPEAYSAPSPPVEMNVPSVKPTNKPLITGEPFRSLNLNAKTQRALDEVFGYDSMSEVQRLTLPVSCQGQDVFAKAKTGTSLIDN